MMMRLRATTKALALCLLGECSVLDVCANAYETATHEQISEEAATRSSLNQVLRDSIGMNAGLDTNVAGQALMLWLRQGARREDSFPRFLNHFHNPLATDWSQAGLGGSVGQSSILWGQNPTQSAPSWSWQDVRQSYFGSLTKPARTDRDTTLVRTLEGLGRQIHLVQDSASPAHTRNDPHILYNYETVADDIRRREPTVFGAWLSGPSDVPGVPGLDWRSLDNAPLAPIAIARLIDTDRYVGTNPAVTMETLIGLAEYTNANFFSEDRIFTENETNPQKRFPYPNRASVTEQDFDIQVGNATVKRRYFVKTGDGATGYRLATVGFLRDYHQRFGLDSTQFRESPTLDEGVYRDYAARLVPRAVAYSTAMLDYFFRGQVGAIGTELAFAFQNQSGEAMDGTFALYYDDQSEVRRPVPGAMWTKTLGPGAVSETVRLSAPTSPPPKDPGKYMLVFRGRLGTEPDAVVGRQIFVDSVITARLVKRKDGSPFSGFVVHAIDVQTGQVISSGVTDQDGKTRLNHRPGRTALFIPSVNLFPMYWAGGSAFVSRLEGARVVQTSDIDSHGQVTIVVPVIAAEWPERIEACTEQPLFANSPNGVFQRTVPVADGTLDLISVTYRVNLITFIRDDDGREFPLCGADTQGACQIPEIGFVAEDVNHVGQVVGRLVRDVGSTHFRQTVDTDGRPIGAPTCSTDYDEVEVVPVTVAEP
jgi:hypothetical protein